MMDDDPAYIHPGGLVELPVQWMAEEGRCFVLTMHPQLSGRASRAALLETFIAHAARFPGTRFLTCAGYAAEVRRAAVLPRPPE